MRKLSIYHCAVYKTVFILFLFIIHSQVMLSQINLTTSKAPLSSVVKKIKNQSKYRFFYNDALGKVQVNAVKLRDVPIQTVLDKLFEGTNITYRIVDQVIYLSFSQKPVENKPNNILTHQGARKTITGIVRDANGEPIIGATVRQIGSNNGVITDIDGRFSITVSEGSKLQISYIGYSDYEVKAADNMDISMVSDVEDIDEVIVVGYGTQRKSDLTGGLVSLNEEKLNLVTTNNLMDRLVGQVPGLTITTGNAAPGQEQSIRIRGVNSLSASNTPLIVLDGIPYSGSLGDINPDMIESMSVLKDASSAAIYGSRGANGVILIQTKKGELGKAHVTYKGQVGYDETERRLNMMTGTEYIKYLQDYYHLKNGIDYSELTPEKVLGSDEYENYLEGKETHWQDVIFRKGFITNHEISISGGTESTKYIASMAHLLQNGVMLNSDLSRTNISLNVVQDLNNWLQIGVNMQATEKSIGGPNPSIESGIKLSPYSSCHDADGNMIYYPMSRNTLFSNPMVNVNADYDHKTRNIFASSFANVQLPLKGLSYRTNFGYNYRTSFIGSYYGRNTIIGKTTGGSASISNTHYYDYTWENILKYERTITDHKFDMTGLFSMQKTHQQYASQSAESFVSDDYSYHNMNAGEKNISISSSLIETKLLSYMFRLNYTFKSKYLITLTGRSDGYSAFGKNNKYAFFPSAAVAWNINSEEFMSDTNDWLDQLKLRLSYGANGNQAINAYQTLDRLSASKYMFGDESVAVNGTYLPTNGVGNPNLKWETTYTFNLGLDYSLFSGRLFGSFDFYLSNTKDLLMTRSVPYMNGYRSIMDNIGQTRNIGTEFTMTTVNMRSNDFEWKTTLNFSWNKDQIRKLTDGTTQDLANNWFVGESSRVYYDYKVVGTWQTNDPAWDATKKKYLNGDGKEIQSGARPGYAKLQDSNGDGIINASDKVIIGSKLPSVLSSLTNNLSFRNVYLSIVLTQLAAYVNVTS